MNKNYTTLIREIYTLRAELEPIKEDIVSKDATFFLGSQGIELMDAITDLKNTLQSIEIVYESCF